MKRRRRETKQKGEGGEKYSSRYFGAITPDFHSKPFRSNEDKVLEHLEKVVFPFIVEKRKDLSLPDEQKAILVFDVFKGQKTERVQHLVADNNCVCVFVRSNMTNYFLPLDLTVNGPAKQFLKGRLQIEVCKSRKASQQRN